MTSQQQRKNSLHEKISFRQGVVCVLYILRFDATLEGFQFGGVRNKPANGHQFNQYLITR